MLSKMASKAEKEPQVKQVVDPGSDRASAKVTVESLRGIASRHAIGSSKGSKLQH